MPLLTEGEGAGAVGRDRDGHLDRLRPLDRVGDLEHAEPAEVVGRDDPHLEEPSRDRHLLVAADAQPQDVATRRGFRGDRDRLRVVVVGGVVGEPGALLRLRQREILPEVGARLLVGADAERRLMLVRKPEVLRAGRIGPGSLPFPRLAVPAEEVSVEQSAHLPACRDLHLRAHGAAGGQRFSRAPPAVDDAGRGATPDGEILLELVARHEECRAEGVVSARPRVVRQARHVDVEPEERAERARVFAPVEPPQRADTPLIADRAPRDGERARQGCEELGRRGRGGTRLLPGWHRAGVEHAEHPLPAFGGLHRGDRRRQVVEPHASLRDVAVVAARAVGLEKHRRGGCGDGLTRLGRPARRTRDREHHAARQHGGRAAPRRPAETGHSGAALVHATHGKGGVVRMTPESAAVANHDSPYGTVRATAPQHRLPGG